MSKKDFLQQKYEELNRLKGSLEDYPKEKLDSILKLVSNVCDDISKYLETTPKKPDNKDYKEDNVKEECKRKDERIFTLEELEQFNGKDGNPPYVAIDGVVYDLSRIKKWKGGKHYGLLAGQVLSEEYLKCHKDKPDLINRAKVVGKLEEVQGEEQRQDKVFTKEELNKYDGKNGRPSYVAVDGIVYDVSKILQWKNGIHYGLMAGEDLTPYFSGCHSDNVDIMKNAVEVGILQQTRQGETYTIDELAKFDGTNGSPSYVAVNGIIYDVTGVKKWTYGKHYGLVAGKDLTEFFNTCHKYEKKILDQLTVVGTLKNS